jgi:nucleoside-diphosphate-sugar epimerase
MLIPLKGRRVTIIGGAGFIGHNLALSLVEQGAEVEIIDSLQVNNLAWLASNPDFINRDLYLKIIHERLDFLRNKGIEVIIQDARDYSALNRMLNVLKPDVIIHLAAVSHAGRSNKDPYSTFDHSLRTLENALDSARGNVEHFIYFSSSMVYGNFLTEEVTEEHPLNPIGIYGALKLAGEKMVIAYQQVFDLPYTIIRPSALYGPRCVSRRVGQVFIENALQGTNLRIEGNGEEKLDFTYIQDLVGAISTVIQNPKARNEIFNMTYGQSRSINELAQIVQSHFPNVTIDYIERDNLMPIRGTLLVDKAKELLGYTPSYPIDIGMPEYIQWYRDFFEKVKA